MTSKYNNIQRLITFWEEFENQNTSSSLLTFSQWLIKKQNEAPRKDEMSNHSFGNTSEESIESNQKEVFVNTISRLSRLQDFYAKRLFDGLPLNNMLEFNFLFSINKNNSLKKKEIINQQLVEYTTGIDIIKRLIRLNLVKEYPDVLDKRSKRLQITSEGKKVLIDALITKKKLELVFFELNQVLDWESSLPALLRLEKHHSKVFSKASNVNGIDLLKILDEEKSRD